MGIPTLQWSPIQLRMVNQWKIIPMGWLYGVTVYIRCVNVVANFEVIEIFNDSNPYSTLLGIYLVIDMNGVITLKKRRTSFERKSLLVIVPLDHAEGAHYTKPVCYIGPNLQDNIVGSRLD